MNAALRGLTLNPHKNVDKPLIGQQNIAVINPNGNNGSQSDGEFKVGKIDMMSTFYGGRPNPGVNRIHKTLETGEVVKPSGQQQQIIGKLSNERSEGEVGGGSQVQKPHKVNTKNISISQLNLPQRKGSSEGEIENPAIAALNRQHEMLEAGLKELSMHSSKSSRKSKSSPKKKKATKSDDKKVVSLKLSPSKQSSKNSIKIQAIRNY